MITVGEFERLLGSAESSVLDFKSSMYKLDDDKELNNVSKLIKDIISFSNTIRNETSYIVIGIAEKDDKTKELIGIDNIYDDAFYKIR